MADKTKQENAAIVVVSIMLALIVKAALEAAFKPLIVQGLAWSTISYLSWGQVIVFFVMILRFYLGAIRYVNAEPANVAFLVRVVNFVFAFLLFCVFYIIALSVIDSAYFYTLFVVLHIIDAAWFLIALALLKLRDTPEVSGEIKLSATCWIIWTFFIFSAITILYGLLSYPLIFNQSIHAKEPISAHWWFLGVLVTISLVDFWAHFEWYFHFEKWKKENSVD